MNIHKPQVLILDFDRTLAYLYRDEQLLLELAEIICDHYAAFLPIDPTLYTMDGYKSWYRLHRDAVQKYAPEEAQRINGRAEELVTAFEARVVARTPFFENVAEALQFLHRDGMELMIVSSNASTVIQEALKREGLLSCFSHVMGRSLPFDPDKLKPNPYPIQQAIEKTSAPKESIWYAGDDLVDVRAAKACGITAIGVASGKYTAQELKAQGADHTIPRLSDICSLFA